MQKESGYMQKNAPPEMVFDPGAPKGEPFGATFPQTPDRSIFLTK
jgi:hypothetical protein